MTEPLLRVTALRVTFRRRGWAGRGRVAAVDGISLELPRGRVLGVIGESGSGKSTLGRAVLGLARVESGTVEFDGADITRRSRGTFRRLSTRIQAVFQDSSGTLDPRMTVRASLREALQHRTATRTPEELLELVGLGAAHADRRPHELSGGQRQRVGIARALAVDPELLICDEPTASLDVSIQAQMLNLLADLTRRLHLTVVFIGHNIAVVRYVSDEVAVMLGGRIVERGPADEVCSRPQHPYTRALVAASQGRVAERADGDEELATAGCPFRPRCPLARALGDPDRCRTEDPALRGVAAGHLAACHFAEVADPASDREEPAP